MAYIDPPTRTEAPQTFKRRIYATLCLLATVGKTPSAMRVVQKRPSVHWDLVWRNLHASRFPEEVRSAWYVVIHDILPTRERLAAIDMTDTNSCRQCGETDTLTHRLTGCGEGPAIGNWTTQRISMMLRMGPKYVPISWILHPEFRLCPHHRRRRTVLWTLAHMVWYQTHGPRRPPMVDYLDYMWCSRWKAYAHPIRLAQVGNYLDLLYGGCYI
jgi:hypothetical protein